MPTLSPNQAGLSFSSMLTDIISVIKKDGQRFENIRASVQSDKIFIMGSVPLIEAGDLINRKMSNGGSETYLVEDPGFRENLGGIPAHYQMKVRKYNTAVTEHKLALPGIPPRESKSMEPVEIRESIAKFRKDHPDSQKLAFILMQFGSSPAHAKILQAVKGSLQAKGITALRADDKEYHGNLLYNVLTYIYGCGFGIAIYERIESERFNPNVSLEVGYMMALGKPVCLLKDRTLPNLNSDLGGMLYRTFEIFDPAVTIQESLFRWLSEKGIPGEHPVTDVPPIPHTPRPVTRPDEQGLDFIQARLASLSEDDRNAFLEHYQPVIDKALRELPRNSRGITQPLGRDNRDLAEAMADIYSNAGWNVRHPDFVEGAWQVVIVPMHR